VVFWLNTIPKVGQEHSPKNLVFGDQLLHYKVVCRIPFGAYAQVHDDRSITNSMESRTTGAISLGTTGNEQPVPRDVIDRLDELTANEPDYENDINIEEKEEDNNDQVREANEEEIDVNPPNVNIEDEPRPTIETEENNNNDLNNGENDEFEKEENEVEVANEDMQENAHGYNLRTNRIRDYSHCFTFLSVQAGLKQFGQKGKEAILEELRMFLAEKVFAYIKNPTPEQKRKALRIHCFLTEKRDGRVKARAAADGGSQIRYNEEETYSPTVRLESIMLSSLIDAMEHRYVAMIDIKGAFLKAKVPDDLELVVKMDGELAVAFAELNPEFQPDIKGV
jgi:hypothetical protein